MKSTCLRPPRKKHKPSWNILKHQCLSLSFLCAGQNIELENKYKLHSWPKTKTSSQISHTGHELYVFFLPISDLFFCLLTEQKSHTSPVTMTDSIKATLPSELSLAIKSLVVVPSEAWSSQISTCVYWQACVIVLSALLKKGPWT